MNCSFCTIVSFVSLLALAEALPAGPAACEAGASSEESVWQEVHPIISKYKGVYWHKKDKRWQAQIGENKKRTYIGSYTNEMDAARAYDKKAKELHGEFARLNFPEVLDAT